MQGIHPNRVGHSGVVPGRSVAERQRLREYRAHPIGAACGRSAPQGVFTRIRPGFPTVRAEQARPLQKPGAPFMRLPLYYQDAEAEAAASPSAAADASALPAAAEVSALWSAAVSPTAAPSAAAEPSAAA